MMYLEFRVSSTKKKPRQQGYLVFRSLFRLPKQILNCRKRNAKEKASDTGAVRSATLIAVKKESNGVDLW